MLVSKKIKNNKIRVQKGIGGSLKHRGVKGGPGVVKAKEGSSFCSDVKPPAKELREKRSRDIPVKDHSGVRHFLKRRGGVEVKGRGPRDGRSLSVRTRGISRKGELD